MPPNTFIGLRTMIDLYERMGLCEYRVVDPAALFATE